MPAALLVVAGLLLAGLALFLFNDLWIYRVLDRATRNQRKMLPPVYEVPRYYKAGTDGSPDYDARWPGWDGWYFFALPDDRDLPVKMIRASLMTGLYGLDGIDNYNLLPSQLQASGAVEALTLIPGKAPAPDGTEKRNELLHKYLPKRSALRMASTRLDTVLTGKDASSASNLLPFGRIAGQWPAYEFRFVNPDSGREINLRFQGENLIWWADVPGIFTYVACFGRFEGTLRDPQSGDLEPRAFSGAGAFEHGFARKPFSLDWLYLPIRLIGRIAPSFRPVRYHYELLIGDEGARGGFMQAAAFGVKVRNRGGIYEDGRYIPIDSVKVTYHDDPAPDKVAGVHFYRRWTVEAHTGEGVLSYTGDREWPPAPVAANMTYYHFTYEGSFRGDAIRGRGYGEYVHI